MSVQLGNPITNFPVLWEGLDIGTVGYRREGDVVWVHWKIRDEYQRQGHGTEALRKLLSDFLVVSRTFNSPVRAMIRPWNHASLGLAFKVGFDELSRDSENVVVELKKWEVEGDD